MHRIGLGFLILLSASPAFSQNGQTLLCVADQSTGFRVENDKWRPANFRVDDKYVVRAVAEVVTLRVKYNYTITEVGKTQPRHRCFRNEGSAQMTCGGLGFGLVVNFETLRYQEYYGIGYVGGENSNDNTPAITIGKCSKIE